MIMKRVAVIGAGAAGLCMARHLLAVSSATAKIDFVVFEKANYVGGTWVYQDVPLHGEVFSSMYKNLLTNLPKQSMQFPGFPFADDAPTYNHHTGVKKYLEDYADNYKLLPHIKFRTEVTRVTPLDAIEEEIRPQYPRWYVETNDLEQKSKTREEFDAVIVCNGHYSVPKYPDIKGLSQFSGTILHSHYYRDPVKYKDLNVLILGAGPSGTDISVELSRHCKNVYLSHRKDFFSSKLPDNLIQKPDISHVNEEGHFVFEDGSEAKVDVFIPCTGYHYDFPFLSENCRMNIEEGVVHGLYKHVFDIKRPSLAFVGIPFTVTPLPLFHTQCAWIASILAGQTTLPSKSAMENDLEMEWISKKETGVPKRYFHKLANNQWPYNDMIAALAKSEKNPRIIEIAYDASKADRAKDMTTYKHIEFIVSSNGDIEKIYN